jgi:YidC/Oxa1 family membrane protein insertase
MSIFSALVAGLATFLTPLAGGFAAALAIVLFTVCVRALISPLSYLRSRGTTLAAQLLPSLAQAPFFFVLYRVAMSPPAGGLFGVPLTAHLFAGLPVFAVLLALAVLLAYLSSRRMPTLRLLPYLTVAVVAWFPLAGALYLVTSTAWTALEQAVWPRDRPGPVTTGNG